MNKCKQHCRGLLAILITSLFISSCATADLGSSGQKKVSGKTYVITGASSGFGRGVAEKLGSYHANVVLAARRTDLLEEVATAVRQAGGRALVVTTDVSKEEDMQRLADAAVKEFGHIDVWVNNAAVGGIGAYWDIPLKDHERIIDVNLKSVIYGSYIAMQLFRAQGYGTLINTGSVESESPLAYHASYAATKAGVRHLGKVLNQELRLSGQKKKIKVITIMPWATDTPFWGHASNYSGHTPRMSMMDPAEKTVNAIIWSSLHRRKEVPVGWKARMAVTSHHIAPRLTERISANVAHKSQMRNAPPAPKASGSLHAPMQSGRGVEDGVEERMERENRERRRSKK
jgi:short-subunit dehydrogenase